MMAHTGRSIRARTEIFTPCKDRDLDELVQCKLELMQCKLALASMSQSLEDEKQAKRAVEAELATTREKLLQAQLVIQTSSCFHQHFISLESSPSSICSVPSHRSPVHTHASTAGSDKSSESTDSDCGSSWRRTDAPSAERAGTVVLGSRQGRTLSQSGSPNRSPLPLLGLDSLPEDEEVQESKEEDRRANDTDVPAPGARAKDEIRACIAGAARPAPDEFQDWKVVPPEKAENKAAGICCLEVDGNISLRGGQRNAQKSSRDDQFVHQVSTPDSRMQNLKERVDFGEWSPTGSALL
jgi:hypothetical protein